MKTFDMSRFVARHLDRPARLGNRQRGVTMIEYALIAALIAVVLVVILATSYAVASSVRFACSAFTSSRISASDWPATRAAAMACAS